MGENIDIMYAIGSIVNHYACDYSGYIMLYTGLFLMIPFLNILYNNLPGRAHKLVLIFSFVFLTSVPTLCNIYVQLYSTWWQRLYPLTYYFIGAYLRDVYDGVEKPMLRRPALALGIIVILFTVYNYLHISPNPHIMTGFTWYDGFETMSVSVLIFTCLIRVDMSRWKKPVAKFFTKLSELSFGMFMFSFISDSFIYINLRQAIESPHDRFIYMPLCVIITLIASAPMVWLAEFITKPIDKAFRKFLLRFEKYFCSTQKLMQEQ